MARFWNEVSDALPMTTRPERTSIHIYKRAFRRHWYIFVICSYHMCDDDDDAWFVRPCIDPIFSAPHGRPLVVRHLRKCEQLIVWKEEREQAIYIQDKISKVMRKSLYPFIRLIHFWSGRWCFFILVSRAAIFGIPPNEVYDRRKKQEIRRRHSWLIYYTPVCPLCPRESSPWLLFPLY